MCVRILRPASCILYWLTWSRVAVNLYALLHPLAPHGLSLSKLAHASP